MDYSFEELVDLDTLQNLCENFTRITGSVTAILDFDGKVLIATGWQDICTQFHRVNPETASRCIESDTVLANQLKMGVKYNIYKCKNGLVDVAVPIIVGGTHVGNLFTGNSFSSIRILSFFESRRLNTDLLRHHILKHSHGFPYFQKNRLNKPWNSFANWQR